MSHALRLLRRVHAEPDGCWLWRGPLDRNGYGYLSIWWERNKVGPRTNGAHQAAYRLFVGEVPEGLELDHLCRVRHCCNPRHLEAVPHRVNYERGQHRAWIAARKKQKPTCPKGHTYDAVARDGSRVCRTCSRAYHRAWYRRMKARA